MSGFINSPKLSAKNYAEFERLMGDKSKGWSNSSWHNDATDSLSFEAKNPELDDELCVVAVLHLPNGDEYNEFYYYELDAPVEENFDTIEEAVKFILTRDLNALL